jgi:hypothetical protein
MENLKKRGDRVLTIDNLIKREKNEYGFPKFKMSVVNKCDTYKKDIGSTSTTLLPNVLGSVFVIN